MIHLIEDVVLGEISTLPRMPLEEDFRSRYREFKSLEECKRRLSPAMNFASKRCPPSHRRNAVKAMKIAIHRLFAIEIEEAIYFGRQYDLYEPGKKNTFGLLLLCVAVERFTKRQRYPDIALLLNAAELARGEKNSFWRANTIGRTVLRYKVRQHPYWEEIQCEASSASFNVVPSEHWHLLEANWGRA